MDRWRGKIALVTGASAGIGAAIALELVKQGMKVVGLARRQEKIEALKKEAKGSGELFSFKADVSKESEIIAAFKFIKDTFGSIHVLVNNAGILRSGTITSQEPKFLREVLDVNVMGLTLCTQQALKLMKETDVDDGHIIHINSIYGHAVPSYRPCYGLYPASKFAVTALTEILRQELIAAKSKIKVTSLSPGFVRSEIYDAAFLSVGGRNLKDLVKSYPFLEPQDIADGVTYVLSTPPRVQVHELTIKPIGEPY